MDLNMNDRITTLEVARRQASKETVMIAEALNMSNEIMNDTPNIACNHHEWHEVLLRDTYPRAELRAYNEGVGSVATQTRTVRESLGEAAIYSIVDKRLAQNSGREKEIYTQEATAIIMGMGIQLADIYIYGSKNKDARSIDGLDVRYRNTNDTRNVFPFTYSATGLAPNVNNKCTSLYICALGAKGMHLLHNSQSPSIGIHREDHGYSDREVAPGKWMPAHVDYFTVQFGLAIEHPDSVKRICNIPMDGSLTAADRALLIEMVLHAQKLLPLGGMNTTVIYGNLSVLEVIERAAREIQVTVFPEKDPWGHPVNLINGMRVRRVDLIKDSGEYPSEFIA
jgi:hypothetical protein